MSTAAIAGSIRARRPRESADSGRTPRRRPARGARLRGPVSLIRRRSSRPLRRIPAGTDAGRPGEPGAGPLPHPPDRLDARAAAGGAVEAERARVAELVVDERL